MLGFKAYRQTEEGMVETKSFMYRLRDVLRSSKKRPKLDSHAQCVIQRTNTEMAAKTSGGNSVWPGRENKTGSVSGNKSLDMERRSSTEYGVKFTHDMCP